MNAPDATGLLNAEHLEELEANGPGAPTTPALLTLPDAVEALRRIKYHNTKQAETASQVAAMIAPLQAKIDEIRAWGKDQADTRQQSIAFHESRLHAFYRLNPPSKGKTITLPGGKVSCKDPADKWTFTEDADALVGAVLAVRPDLVKSVVVNRVDKNDIKREARVQDGKAYLVDGAGELAELPVTVTEQPATYKVELA